MYGNIVTQEQHDATVAKLFVESPDHVILRESPADDVKRTEELIGIEEGTLPNFTFRFAKGGELCKKCGRHFNVLDLFSTALKSHSKEFLKEVMFGNKIRQGNGGHALTCHACGTEGDDKPVYATSIYSCLHD